MILMFTICTCSLVGIVGCLLDKRIESLEKRIERLEVNKDEIRAN